MKGSHIKGMLLEEAILHFLKRSGYKTINEVGSDTTLCKHSAGMAVKGRGSSHQIDAIADFQVLQPFSNPQRLLIEAKCYDDKTSLGVSIIRNAVGVLKDVSEFWVPSKCNRISGYSRYHYQYAVFSSTPFSRNAQDYAFAHDVYLFPLNRSKYFEPILDGIAVAVMSFVNTPESHIYRDQKQLSELREYVRKWLSTSYQPDTMPALVADGRITLPPFIDACIELKYALVGMLGGRFPVLFVPSSRVLERGIQNNSSVRIYWNDEGWFLYGTDGEALFSFDLPDELFLTYADEGLLSPNRALDLKRDVMSSIQAIDVENEQLRILNFTLDIAWLEEVRQKIGHGNDE
jgi:hypothetical protein